LQTCGESAPGGHGVVILETAGGVNSPAPSGTPQADVYRPLRLPVLLVADMKLGGISSTISAFESLHVRGYDLDSVLVFRDDRYQNNEYLSEYFSKIGIEVTSIPPPPPRRQDSLEDKQELVAYYKHVSEMDAIEELITSCHQRHDARIQRLESMASRALSTIWFPFTQHQGLPPEKLLTIDSAYGDFFQTLAGLSASERNSKEATKENVSGILQSSLDGSASWWTQGLGHGSPKLSLAAAYAAGRYGHVMFAGAIHEPALLLAELLLKHLNNPKLRKLFYSDNGSTGIEVAVKMALTASSKRYGWGKDRGLGVLGLKGSYHGDTIGAMDCSEGSTFNRKVHWYQGRGFWLDFPQVKMKDGKWIVEPPAGREDIFGPEKTFGSLSDIFSVQRDNSDMKKRYERYIRETLVSCIEKKNMRLGCLILEPLILGAGGMLFW
jgi:dethiobiotin synthetase/adenosylmethionine--8-amino-7-oxononanoate aminotransferase